MQTNASEWRVTKVAVCELLGEFRFEAIWASDGWVYLYLDESLIDVLAEVSSDADFFEVIDSYRDSIVSPQISVATNYYH